jgi:hypothetical protein
MANGDDRKAKLPEGYVLDQEWESGEGPTAAATTAAGQSTPPGARDTAGDLGKLGAISRTVGDTVRGAVTPSKPQGKTASEEAGEAIKRGWRALVTPPPPRLPPQGPARETMGAQPGFWSEVGRLAGQGPGRMEPRAPAYENMTPEGRAEHPILSRVGDVTRGAKEYGGMLLNLGGLLAGPEYEEFPNAAPRPAARAPGSQMPAVPRTTLRDIGNVLENEMNRPPLPRIEPQFDKVAHDLFGKPYEELNGAQKRDVAMRAVRAPTERGTIQPVERRRPGGAPMGAPPGGVERRLPWVQQTFGAGAPGAESDIELELRGGPAPLAPVGEVGTVKPRTWTPSSTKGGVVIRGGKVVPEEGAPPPSAAGTTELPPSRRETILPERKPAPFTLETEPSTGIRYAKSAGIPHVSVPARLTDPREIEAYVREKQALQPPEKKPPTQPGTPERPPPTTEEDPIKVRYPDPVDRRFVRANGEEAFNATRDNPDAMQAIHDLKNWEVREAAINAGIDVGQKHVGSRLHLGEEQISRQELLDQMIRQGVKPEAIPELAKPREKPSAPKPIPMLDLKAEIPKAAIGEPVTFEAYRTQDRPTFGGRPERGTFFSPEATAEHGPHVFHATLHFENPLVVTDGVEAAKILKRPGLAQKYENLLSGMNETGEEVAGPEDEGRFFDADKELAEHARAAGYDGIMFDEHDGLNPTQYIALKPEAIQNVRKIGKFNWKNMMVEPESK